MKIDTYKCDVCGKQKGDVNHWWVLWTRGKNPTFQIALELRTWNEESLKGAVWADKHFHLCGQECVLKQVTEFMGESNG